jgi:hypothetical protein
VTLKPMPGEPDLAMVERQYSVGTFSFPLNATIVMLARGGARNFVDSAHHRRLARNRSFAPLAILTPRAANGHNADCRVLALIVWLR